MALGIEAFQSAAQSLGLRLEAPDLPWWKDNDLLILEGELDGTPVFVQQGVLTVGGRYQTRVYFHAAIDPPLDLGLSISLRASGYTVSQPLGERDLDGSPAFDAAFIIEGAERDRTNALFTRELRGALITWHNARKWERYAKEKSWMEFWISDQSVILRLEPGYFAWGFGSKATLVEELVADVRATAALARAVGEAARNVPPSALLAPHAPAWRAFAEAHGHRFSASPLSITGTMGDVPFAVRAVWQGKGTYGVELTVPFARPLPAYLRVGRQTHWWELSRRWATYPDAWSEWLTARKTGDETFDEVFRVVTANAEAEDTVLSEDVRGALLELGAWYEHVHMTTEVISVRTPGMIPPAEFEGVLRSLARIEKLIDASTRRLESGRGREEYARAGVPARVGP